MGSKHRAESTRRRGGGALGAVRTSLALSTLAVAATGAVLGSQTAIAPSTDDETGSLLANAQRAVAAAGLNVGESAERAPVASRSDRRESSDPAKQQVLAQEAGEAITVSEDLSDADPKTIAQALLPEFGFSADQFGCLDQLYISESNWRVDADNPTSTAYGIPQALTGLHELPADYMTSAESQIRWGLDYIRDAYGTPCSAWAFKQAHQWY